MFTNCPRSDRAHARHSAPRDPSTVTTVLIRPSRRASDEAPTIVLDRAPLRRTTRRSILGG